MKLLPNFFYSKNFFPKNLGISNRRFKKILVGILIGPCNYGNETYHTNHLISNGEGFKCYKKKNCIRYVTHVSTICPLEREKGRKNPCPESNWWVLLHDSFINPGSSSGSKKKKKKKKKYMTVLTIFLFDLFTKIIKIKRLTEEIFFFFF